ncbi:MAG: DUF1449 family protein [Marinicella sp.]|nr:DUF1449 family protein [Xanthomonadales bacterium]
MELFLQNITSFPVVVFTFLLAIICCYWILAMIGAVDIDMFDIDADIDVDVDVDADVNINTDISSDLDTEGLGGVMGFMVKWGLTGIPVTVIVSVLIATSWLICYLVVSLLYPLIPWGGFKYLIGVVLLIVSFLLSVPVTARLIRPFKKIFVSHSAVKKPSLIGMECVVKTGKVNSQFGQAELEDGGAGMILDVRADEALNIRKGDLVILTAYNDDDGSFQVNKVE